MDGILNVLKPPGMTSHDVINWVRRNLKEKKAGHIGTLDPGASGVLPIFLGKATKVITYIAEDQKVYRAQIIFGIETETQDKFGEILNKRKPEFNLSQFNQALKHFTGKVIQRPSKYSAIKVKGKKLYEYARQGIDVEVPTREIYIKSIKILHHKIPHYAFLEIKCSKGTYIRSLCNDIGQFLGSGAHMGFLLRTHSGLFNIQTALTLEEIELFNKKNTLLDRLIPLDYPLKGYPRIDIKSNAENSLKNGNSIFPQGILDNIEGYKDSTKTLAYVNNELLSIGEIKYDNENNRNYFKPMRVL
jgi:tRNA pseudouridine55 synthase